MEEESSSGMQLATWTSLGAWRRGLREAKDRVECYSIFMIIVISTCMESFYLGRERVREKQEEETGVVYMNSRTE